MPGIVTVVRGSRRQLAAAFYIEQDAHRHYAALAPGLKALAHRISNEAFEALASTANGFECGERFDPNGRAGDELFRIS